MREEQVFLFDSFRLELANASLRRGKHEVFLTPKAFSMLRYLVEHAGQLVTKDDLWHAAWPGITVTDAALTVCMSEVRRRWETMRRLLGTLTPCTGGGTSLSLRSPPKQVGVRRLDFGVETSHEILGPNPQHRAS